jgi:hypothetical protein
LSLGGGVACTRLSCGSRYQRARAFSPGPLVRLTLVAAVVAALTAGAVAVGVGLTSSVGVAIAAAAVVLRKAAHA